MSEQNTVPHPYALDLFEKIAIRNRRGAPLEEAYNAGADARINGWTETVIRCS
jgi:hypothetical protein